jgi:cystathionine beta-lyase/cystathionine gamma-synthase
MAGGFGGMLSVRVHRASIEGTDSHVPADPHRLSVGNEDPGDLAADLECALGT